MKATVLKAITFLILGSFISSNVMAAPECAENVCSVGSPVDKRACGCPVNDGEDKVRDDFESIDAIIAAVKTKLSPEKIKKLQEALDQLNGHGENKIAKLSPGDISKVTSGELSCGVLFARDNISCLNLDKQSSVFSICGCAQSELQESLTGRSSNCSITPGATSAVCRGEEYELVGSSAIGSETSRRRQLPILNGPGIDRGYDSPLESSNGR